MGSFWNWFIGEAGAGWIFGIIGLLSTLYLWLQRERPPRVVIQVKDQTSFLNLHPSAQERLRIFHIGETGENVPIQSLEQTEIIIYNTGTKDINDPLEINIRFHFKKAQAFWELWGDDKEGIIPMQHITHNDYIETQFTLPYLNSYLMHKQQHTIFLFSEQSAEIELRPSFGKGWSSYFVPLDEIPIEQKRTQALLRLAIMVGATISLLIGLAAFLSLVATTSLGDIDGLVLITLILGPFYLYTIIVTALQKKIINLAYRNYPSIPKKSTK